MIQSRRGFLGLLCAPAIIKVADLMPIKLFDMEPYRIITEIPYDPNWKYKSFSEIVIKVLRANDGLSQENMLRNNILLARLKHARK